MLDAASREALGRPMGWSDADLASCVDALEVVKTRRAGGPAPETVEDALRRHTATVDRDDARLASERERLATSCRELDRVADALTRS